MKRLIEAQNLTDKRRKATKKYQHAESQRSKAMAQNALAKVETAALDDPHVSQAYDLWNAQDEKKGIRKRNFSKKENILFLK